MNTCPSCGGVIGRDCFNPVECAQITDSMYNGDEYQRGFNDGQQYAITHLQAQKGERVWREVDVTEHSPIEHGAYFTTDIFGQKRSSYYPSQDWDNSVASWLEPAPPLAPENEAVGWIRVEDGLPEIDIQREDGCSDFVLVATNNGLLVSAHQWDGKNWYSLDSPHPESRIAYWMPLPAPPPTTLHHL